MTATEKRHNGWTNYETWNVALWIDNEQGSYRKRQAMAQEAWDETEDNVSAYARMTGKEIFTRKERAARLLAENLKAWICDEDCPDLGSSLYSDLLSAALSEVNWDEIATNWIDEGDFKEEACGRFDQDAPEGYYDE